MNIAFPACMAIMVSGGMYAAVISRGKEAKRNIKDMKHRKSRYENEATQFATHKYTSEGYQLQAEYVGYCIQQQEEYLAKPFWKKMFQSPPFPRDYESERYAYKVRHEGMQRVVGSLQ